MVSTEDVKAMFSRQADEIRQLKRTHAEQMAELKTKHEEERAKMNLPQREPKKWFPNGLEPQPKADFSAVEAEIAMTREMLAKVTATTDTGPTTVTPAECVRAIKLNFKTIVLATMDVYAWSVAFAGSFLTLIRTSAATCSVLNLYSIKGGDACDQEIMFMEYAMEKLGFSVYFSRKNLSDPTRLSWTWSLPRCEGDRFWVGLVQFPDSDTVYVERAFLPKEKIATAPNLSRVAVVSCPVEGPRGENVNDKLNEKINTALERIAGLAEEKGWCPMGANFEETNRAKNRYLGID